MAIVELGGKGLGVIVKVGMAVRLFDCDIHVVKQSEGKAVWCRHCCHKLRSAN